jgi:hypothetical protein
MPLTRLIKPLVPPLLWSIGRDVKRRLVRSVDHYAYAPLGWNTPLPAGNGNDAYWSTFVGREQAGCQELIARVRGGAPLLTTDDEMLNYVMLGYVLALASRHRDALRVIDYGGNLGEYYWVGKALVPGIAFEFHCRELPPVAAAGRALSPEVIWPRVSARRTTWSCSRAVCLTCRTGETSFSRPRGPRDITCSRPPPRSKTRRHL